MILITCDHGRETTALVGVAEDEAEAREMELQYCANKSRTSMDNIERFDIEPGDVIGEYL